MDDISATLEKVKETAKGSDKERLNRLEIAVQQIKGRLSRIEEKLKKGEDE